MSEFDRRTGVKHLRVRVMKAVRFAEVMKAIGLNIFRASRYRKAISRSVVPLCDACLACVLLFEHVKDQIYAPNGFSWSHGEIGF